MKKIVSIMRVIAATLAVVILSFSAASQNFDMYVVKPGKNPSWSIPDSAEYRFAEFQMGYFEMPEGKRSQDMQLNFNQLFVAPVMVKGQDTMMIATNIKTVWIGRTCYVLSGDKYYELLSFSQPVKLAKQHFLRHFRTEFVDSYGTASTARTTQTIRGQRPPGSPTLVNEISQNAQHSYRFQTDYYFIGPNGKAEVAKKNMLIKRIKSKEKRDKVKAFVEENNTDFKSEGDLIKLMQYCEEIYRE